MVPVEKKKNGAKIKEWSKKEARANTQHIEEKMKSSRNISKAETSQLKLNP